MTYIAVAFSYNPTKNWQVTELLCSFCYLSTISIHSQHLVLSIREALTNTQSTIISILYLKFCKFKFGCRKWKGLALSKSGNLSFPGKQEVFHGYYPEVWY